jgi:hypothetical protein
MTVLSILGWVLTIPVAYFLFKNGFDKIIGSKESIGNFQYMKLEDYRIPVGILEVIGVILLTIPSTSVYGLILITTIMGGAVALHLSLMGGKKVWFPMLIGLLTVGSYFIR